MNTKRLRGLLAGGAICVAATILAAHFADGQLEINGKTMQTDFMNANGRIYVPLADVATAFNMQVVKHRANDYELVARGGANQINGVEGEIGQTLTTPIFRVTAKSVQFTTHYNRQFTSGDPIDAADGKILAIVNMEVKNAQTKNVAYGIYQPKTVLTDDQQQTYEPSTGGWSDAKVANLDMLPGSAVDFAMVFQIPKGTNVKDLIYEASGIGAPSTIFRIHINQKAE